MVAHYTLTLNGNAQRLSSVLPAGDSEKSWSVLTLEAGASNTHVVYVGGYPQLVSNSDYAFTIPAPVDSVVAPVIVMAPGSPSLRLSEWQVTGTNGEKVQIGLKD